MLFLVRQEWFPDLSELTLHLTYLQALCQLAGKS
jgi:hypothetical protein